jgi:hypothetical protein
VIIIDSLLIGGLKFVFGKIAAAVDAELSDDTVYREELLAAQMRLEMGEIGEAEFAALERELLAAIRLVRERRTGVAESPGDLRVTGIEAEVWSDDGPVEDEGPNRPRRG